MNCGALWYFMTWKEKLKWYLYSTLLQNDAKYFRAQYYACRELHERLYSDVDFAARLPPQFESNPKEVLFMQTTIKTSAVLDYIQVEVKV